MFKTIQAAALASILAVVAPLGAHAITIDFETLANGTAFDGGNGGRIIDNEYRSLGVQFRSFNAAGDRVNVVAANLTNPVIIAPSGINLINPQSGLGGFIEISFFGQAFLLNGTPQTFAGQNILVPSVTDFVSIAFVDSERPGSSITAFDASGAVIKVAGVDQRIDVSCAPGADCTNLSPLAPTQFVSIAAPGIARIRLEYGGTGSGPDTLFDNLTFNTPSSVSRVPLPAGLPLLATALGLFGWLSTRRRTAA